VKKLMKQSKNVVIIKAKEFIKNNPKKLKIFIGVFNIIFGGNKIRLKPKNRLIIGSSIYRRTRITINGEGNTIHIGDLCRLNHCSISIIGSNNLIFISDRVFLNKVDFCIEDDSNEIRIGSHTSIHGSTEFAAIESKKIVVGEDCMFSGEIHFRTGDSHSVISQQGERINPSEDIIIGNHVWVGMRVMCMKGVVVRDNCIIGAGSFLNAKYEKGNCTIAGSPAKIVKENINWLRERI